MNWTHFWTAAWHAGVYVAANSLLLLAAYWVLDLLTPGHLGTKIQTSRSAALVASVWVIANAFILNTSIFVNGAGGVAGALAWTLGFGILGIIANTLIVLAVDALTPGDLRAVIMEPGERAHNYAWLTAAFIIGVSLIICVSIT